VERGIKKMKKQALEGLKVVDFSWVFTGPIVTKYLGDHGARSSR
jgi:crotonobetainyl-CoA:carnitine CoA-transferase CaiB-like acyl-CoA transferase